MAAAACALIFDSGTGDRFRVARLVEVAAAVSSFENAGVADAQLFRRALGWGQLMAIPREK